MQEVVGSTPILSTKKSLDFQGSFLFALTQLVPERPASGGKVLASTPVLLTEVLQFCEIFYWATFGKFKTFQKFNYTITTSNQAFLTHNLNSYLHFAFTFLKS